MQHFFFFLFKKISPSPVCKIVFGTSKQWTLTVTSKFCLPFWECSLFKEVSLHIIREFVKTRVRLFFSISRCLSFPRVVVIVSRSFARPRSLNGPCCVYYYRTFFKRLQTSRHCFLYDHASVVLDILSRPSQSRIYPYCVSTSIEIKKKIIITKTRRSLPSI